MGGKRFTVKEKRKITMLAESGVSQLKIGEIVGRCQQSISRIVNGQTAVTRIRLTTILPEPVAKLLTQAAERRQMTASDLAAQLLGGVICRGAIDATVQKWNRYENSRKLGTCDSHSSRQRQRAGEGGNGQLPEV